MFRSRRSSTSKIVLEFKMFFDLFSMRDSPLFIEDWGVEFWSLSDVGRPRSRALIGLEARQSVIGPKSSVR